LLFKPAYFSEDYSSLGWAAGSLSRWFTSHSASKNFMQKSVVSQNMANPSMVPLPNRVHFCQSSFTLLRTSSLVTLSSQLIFSILLISISTFQRHLVFCLSESTSMSLLHTVPHSRPNISLFSSFIPHSFYQ